MSARPAPLLVSVRTAGRQRRRWTFEGQERFAAYVAHELRGPVALQRTLVEVTLADPEADTAALRRMGERVVAGCEQQQRLIEALLDLTRCRCALLRREPADLAVIAAEALRAHDLSGLESVVVLEPVWTTGDRLLLERLAANLVSNATRHNVPEGGRIDVATRSESGRAVLSVANSGPLIPADELPRLFYPFRRLASVPTGAAEGVGLGLAIVRAVADAHGAFVTARARPGGGLEVEVDFPAAPGRRAARRAANAKTDDSGAGVRRPRRAGPPRVLTGAAIVAVTGLALLAAGCGRPSARGPTHDQALAYAVCLRSHGVPNWPDPSSSGVFDKAKLTPQQLGASSARVQAAQTACRHLLPNGGRPPNQAEQQQIRARALSFSQCVRAHGVSNFPDPAGDGRIPDPARFGIDQGSPKFEAANNACRKYRPSYIPSNSAYNVWARTHTTGS